MIIHIDIDCFFVSAERILDPSLRGKPVAVGGRADQDIYKPKGVTSTPVREVRGAFTAFSYYSKYPGGNRHNWEKFFREGNKVRGIAVTSSYEARAYGVKTGMPLGEALRLCPGLIILPQRMGLYHDLSAKLKNHLSQHIPVLEQSSIDEFYGDLQGWVADEEAEAFAEELRQGVWQALQIPVSIGLGATRTYAKIATGTAKPGGVRHLDRQAVFQRYRTMALQQFPGIGRRMGRKLASYGAKTVGDLLEMPGLLPSLKRPGRDVYNKIHGIGDTAITTDRERKSVGISRRFDPIVSRTELHRRGAILSRHLAYLLLSRELNPTTFYYALRYEDGLSSKHQTTIDRLFSERLLRDLTRTMLEELDLYPGKPVNGLVISARNFAGAEKKTLDLLDHDRDQNEQNLSLASLKLRKKYGVDVLSWGAGS